MFKIVLLIKKNGFYQVKYILYDIKFNLVIMCMRVCYKKLMFLYREKLGYDQLCVLGYLLFRYIKRVFKIYQIYRI